MEKGQDKENVYCIFKHTIESPNKELEKAFEIYLKDLLKTKDLSLEKNLRKD